MKVTRSAAYALHAMMYMVRHATQLPVTTATVAKAEGVPANYLAKIFQQLVKAGFVKAVRGRKKGYAFAKSPEQITVLELLEKVEGGPLFDDCLLRHCECGGTQENCRVFSTWVDATQQLKKLLSEMTIATAAWSHPEHRFLNLAESLTDSKNK
jgi:Rrf2 family iron-sulfur cluster assembly transcriptional regulator